MNIESARDLGSASILLAADGMLPAAVRDAARTGGSWPWVASCKGARQYAGHGGQHARAPLPDCLRDRVVDRKVMRERVSIRRRIRLAPIA
jgi:hypothetical protein